MSSAGKNIESAIAFLKRYELGTQPPSWLAPAMLTASQLGVEEDNDTQAPVRMFSHEAVVVYLVDQGDHYEWVDEADMVAADLTFDQLHEIGVMNLARMFDRLRIDDVGGVLMLSGLGLFEASMILCTPLWESDEFLSRFGLMGPIASIASQDTLGVCVRGDDDALDRLRQGRQAVWSKVPRDTRLCQDLYAMTIDGRWLPYKSEHSPLDGPSGNLPDHRRNLAPPSATPPGPKYSTLIGPLPPEQRVPLNPRPDGTVIDPMTPVEAVGGVRLEIPAAMFESLDQPQYELLVASGYQFDSDKGHFYRACVGEPGAPADPWTLPEWQNPPAAEPDAEDTAKRRWFRRKP